MRKLLLGTTALAAAASITANAALADVSISGFYEWRYNSVSSDITANDGTSFTSDSEIAFKFSNKTDSGLDIGLTVEMFTDGGDSDIEESSISIAGGFGTIVLGQNDGVGDALGVSASDLPAEEIAQIGTSATVSIKNADYVNLSSNRNVVAYYLPAMGGLKTAVSYDNSGATGATDSTEVAAQYAMDAGGASVTLGFATGTKEASGQDEDTQVLGVKISSGNITAALSQSTHEASGSDEESNGAAVSFKVSDAMNVTFHTTETEDDSTSEEYTNTGAEISYTIASGLTAYLNVEDYDYKVGTSGGNADSGTASKLTIKASF